MYEYRATDIKFSILQLLLIKGRPRRLGLNQELSHENGSAKPANLTDLGILKHKSSGCSGAALSESSHQPNILPPRA